LFSKKSNFYLSTSVEVKIFKTFILPYFDYCSTMSINLSEALVHEYFICLNLLFKLFISQFTNCNELDNYTWILIRNHYTWYRKKSIERPKGIHFFLTHNFWTACHNTTIKAYFDRKMSTFQNMRLSLFSYVWLKRCVEKTRISPGLSVEILRKYTLNLLIITRN